MDSSRTFPTCSIFEPRRELYPYVEITPNDAFDVYTPQREKALIGIRGERADRELALLVSSRKNLPGGCIPIRPCFCTLSKTEARNLRPVNFSRPSIRLRTRPGGRLFPSYATRNVDPAIRAVLKKLLTPFRAIRVARVSPRRGKRASVDGATGVDSGHHW